MAGLSPRRAKTLGPKAIGRSGKYAVTYLYKTTCNQIWPWMATKPHLCQFLLTEMGEIYSRKLKRWFLLTATRTFDWSRAGTVSSLGAAPQLPQMTRSCPKHQTRHNGDRKPSEPSRRRIDRCRPSRHIPSFDITELLPLTVKSHTECAERSLALLGHNQF